MVAVPTRLLNYAKGPIVPPAVVIFAPGVYTLGFSLFLRYEQDLTLKSLNAADPAIIQAKGNIQILLYVQSATFEDIHFTGFINRVLTTTDVSQSLHLRGCHFRNNSVLATSGAALHFEGDFLSIEDCVFEGNIATAQEDTDLIQGGAVSFLFSVTAHSAEIQIKNSRFEGSYHTSRGLSRREGGGQFFSFFSTAKNIDTEWLFLLNSV
jgi:hypothetical protein